MRAFLTIKEFQAKVAIGIRAAAFFKRADKCEDLFETDYFLDRLFNEIKIPSICN